MKRLRSRRALAAFTALFVLVVAGAVGAVKLHEHETEGKMALLGERLGVEDKDAQRPSQGTENGGQGGEAFEALTAAQQFAEARTSPTGIVNPGAYSAAVGSYQSLPATRGTWVDVTRRKYDADSPAYRDYYSNSSGGSGLVTGRVTGLAADAAGDIWAAGANGGVWRRLAAGGGWTPIADGLPSLSSGDLELGPDGALWLATGEANTGGTSYVGSGVYRLTNPTSGTFTTANRVGGDELESTTIGKVRFSKDGKTAWAATLRGVWFMPLANGAPAAAHWTLAYAPNPQYLPSDLQQYTATGSQMAGATFGVNTSSSTSVPYKNIVNDVAVDPKNANHVIAAIGWRSGDTYNGFYESTDAGRSWTKINPGGAMPADDIGYVTFAYSRDGSKLYAINQSPRKLNQLGGTSTFLDAFYVSNNGSLTGPWNQIATSDKLGATATGSALANVAGRGYSPGIQSWYNQFLIVDPNDANHVYAGLEEVYETTDGGQSWDTVGPYWNFYFSCWAPDATYNSDTGAGNRCPLTTHPDQHSVAIGGTGANAFVVVGNDGGVYRRPLHGSVNGNNNATDWQSLNDGTIDALQYYAVGIGFINSKPHTITSTGSDNGATVDETTLPEVGGKSGVLVSGGLQDNGGSLLNPAGGNMVSNFGGDGGDVLVDPTDGCNIVQEYVYLSMTLTQTCAHPTGADRANAFLDLSQSTSVRIDPGDVNARFIAPFAANKTKQSEWLAGGNSLWLNTKGWAIRSGSEWAKAFTLASGAQVYTAVAMTGDTAVGGWCGPCNNSGFTRGITIGHRTATGWSFANVPTTNLPVRFVGGVAVAPDGTVYAAMNGFSRRFTEGPGADAAGVGHVYRYDPSSSSWVLLDGTTFPDVPANSIQVLKDGSLVVGTDIGVLYEAAGSTTWQRLGTGLPLTVAMDVEQGPDGNIYAATHGRGIWRIATP